MPEYAAGLDWKECRKGLRVEKKVAGIIKWLERLKQSYSSGAMESALMDAECARADLEDLRLDVWEKVSPSAHRNSAAFSRVLGYARTFSLSVIIVMASVVPLSRDVKAPEIEPLKNARAYAGPIVVFREYERPADNTVVHEDEAPVTEHKLKPTERTLKPETKIADSSPKKQPAQKRTAQKRTQTPAKTDTKHKSSGTVPYDKVYSLIQTGRRALKNNTSVIKIQ